MKVLQVISGMGLKSGGPTTCTYNLLKGLQNKAMTTELLTFDAIEGDTIISRESFINIMPPPKHPRFGYSKELKKWLAEHNDYALYHTNALWQYAAHAAAVAARKQHKPYIVSPHGMLYPEGLKTSKYFKQVALTLFQRKDLLHATALHATSQKELSYIRAFGLKQPVAVIPNAIDVQSIHKKQSARSSTIRKIGFLGRIAPIKNLEPLIEAWAKVNTESAELLIIGDGDVHYVNELKALIQKRSISNIKFLGFLTGKDQEDVMQQLSYLILPSKSENFGMVVPEALARKIPVIASKGTPWEELNTHNCGWWINNDVATLTSTLEIALSLEEMKREQMGGNGRDLVEQRYSIESVSQAMYEFYEWVLSPSKKVPTFVNLLE